MRRTSLPIDHLLTWAKLNGVLFHDATLKTGIVHDGIEKGTGLVATTELVEGESRTLITVPADLILTREEVKRQVALDTHMKTVLDVAGGFGKTARGAIMIFLLLQITQSSPDYEGEVLTKSCFTDYVKLLPENVLLPTFYTEEEKELLFGTTLQDPLEQKLQSLEREFGELKESLAENAWAQKHWWDERTGKLSFADWMLVDALYRSRSLELPGLGHAMVPCIDLANHASRSGSQATYELDSDGSVLLRTKGSQIEEGEEICISYGDGKSACEMLFSYGCLEVNMQSPVMMFLDLDIPDDDPLRTVKKSVNKEESGFRIVVEGDALSWEGDYVWWSCVNEENGLDFRVAQELGGSRQLEMTWHGQQIEPSDLRSSLEKDPKWEILQLRAVVMLEERVQLQMDHLEGSQSNFAEARGQDGVRDVVWNSITALRSLETEVVDRFYWVLDEKVRFYLDVSVADKMQKSKLCESETVQLYLRSQQEAQLPAMDIKDNGESDADFS